ncbi:MAG: hypothetical protein WA771_00115, partial [Chthoniobacterales bacterium]
MKIGSREPSFCRRTEETHQCLKHRGLPRAIGANERGKVVKLYGDQLAAETSKVCQGEIPYPHKFFARIPVRRAD